MPPDCVGNEVPLSVSIGVAQWTRDIGAFPDRLIAAADHALYVAKKEGPQTASRSMRPGADAGAGYGAVCGFTPEATSARMGRLDLKASAPGIVPGMNFRFPF